jgi:hypothetical protein
MKLGWCGPIENAEQGAVYPEKVASVPVKRLLAWTGA